MHVIVLHQQYAYKSRAIRLMVISCSSITTLKLGLQLVVNLATASYLLAKSKHSLMSLCLSSCSTPRSQLA